MACEVIQTKDGPIVTMILCRHGRRQMCKHCGRNPVSKLCDYPVAPGKTCDFPMCARCATNIAHEVDYCPKHKDVKPPAQQLDLLEEIAEENR